MTKTPKPTRKKKRIIAKSTKGFACPSCIGVRLHIETTVRPIRGLVVRYRRCAVCGHRTKTEERVAKR